MPVAGTSRVMHLFSARLHKNKSVLFRKPQDSYMSQHILQWFLYINFFPTRLEIVSLDLELLPEFMLYQWNESQIFWMEINLWFLWGCTDSVLGGPLSSVFWSSLVCFLQHWQREKWLVKAMGWSSTKLVRNLSSTMHFIERNLWLREEGILIHIHSEYMLLP